MCLHVNGNFSIVLILSECTIFFHQFSGRYKVEIFDRNINDFVPTVYGLGMHVEIRDPEDKLVLSRVRLLDWRMKHVED